MSAITLKFTVLGDANVGKSNLITTYTSNYYTSAYIPTVEETYYKTLTVARSDGEPCFVELVIYDLGGGEEYDRLRMLLLGAQGAVDAFILCFKLGDGESTRSIVNRWKEVVDYVGRGAPVVVVGCIADMALPGAGHDGVADIVGASAYFECSAQNHSGVRGVFETAVALGLKKMEEKLVREPNGKEKE